MAELVEAVVTGSVARGDCWARVGVFSRALRAGMREELGVTVLVRAALKSGFGIGGRYADLTGVLVTIGSTGTAHCHCSKKSFSERIKLDGNIKTYRNMHSNSIFSNKVRLPFHLSKALAANSTLEASVVISLNSDLSF